MKPTSLESEELDLGDITRELDRTKSKVFMSKKNPAFLGSLMCSLNFLWTRDMPTAATDSINFWWNPDYFTSLPPDSRETDLVHELWHVGLLHMIRRGSRDPGLWNWACDIRIDLLLESEGYTFEGINGVPRDHKYIDWAEEDIYDDLLESGMKPPPGMCGCHQLPDSQANKQATVNHVVKSLHQAKLSGQAGNIPGSIKEHLDKFLEPIIPWEKELMDFFSDLLDEEYSWARPNRRYTDMYLPSRFLDDGRLEHLIYYLDVSGSITEAHSIRFNSEVKYIQEVLKPKKLTLVQFDTKIQDEKVFEEEDPFTEIEIIGRGGTSLVPVREHIIKHRPTAAVVFSDLWVEPMEELPYDLPIIWVAVGNKGATVPFGKLIHIN